MRFRYGLLLVAATSLRATPQEPKTLALGRPNSKGGPAHSEIGFVAEAAGGRVYLNDPKDKQVFLADLTGGTEQPVGRAGAGPREYQTPGRLVQLPGDSALLVDFSLRRAVLLSPDGTMGDILVSVERRATLPPALLQPEAADTSGRLYARAAPMVMRGEQPITIDSAVLIRLDRRSGRVDSLGMVRAPKSEVQISRSGSGSNAKITGVQVLRVPFAPFDRWVVQPDGTVVIVRDGDYRVDRIEPSGKRTSGRPLPWSPVPLTAADKSAYEWWKGPWPATKPAVDPRTASVWLAPNGDLWIRRAAPAADSTGHYDIVDPAGRLAARLVTPLRSRIAGIGRGGIYLVRVDEDGLETLERYPIPAR